MSAEIIRLCERRADAEATLAIDLHTAIDVAIRDLREIEAQWGTALGLLSAWQSAALCCGRRMKRFHSRNRSYRLLRGKQCRALRFPFKRERFEKPFQLEPRR